MQCDEGASGTRGAAAIDLFPRCVLVLRRLEGISIEDTATLLEENKDLVREAQVIGLYSLADFLYTARRTIRGRVRP